MPVLYSAPNSDYSQVAMVDVTADYGASDETVFGLLRQKACETGADAVIVVNNRRQTRGAPLPGYAAGEPDDVGPQSGANISERQHSPELGEVGHEGRVLNGVAIIYPERPRTSSDNGTPRAEAP